MNPKPVIIAGLCAVLFVVTVYFGGKYALEQRRAEYSKQSKKSLAKRKTRRATKPTETTENSPSNPPTTNALIDEQETSITSEPAPTVDIELSTAVEEAETPQTEDEPVSPHGFGPYPAIPDDYPWEVANWQNFRDGPKQELIQRVRIKLWKQGIRADGATYGPGGKIYPVIRGIAYVKWQERRDGSRYIADIILHPSDTPWETQQELEAGRTPNGFTVLEFHESGIDPYEFLNIK